MRQLDTHSFARPLWRGALIAGAVSVHAQAQPLDVSGTVSGASARGVSGGFGLGQAAADWSATRF